MMKNRVIKFDSKERILKKARSYVESVETFFDESEQAIPLLLKELSGVMAQEQFLDDPMPDVIEQWRYYFRFWRLKLAS